MSERPHSRSTASASRARPPSAISSASLIPRLNWPPSKSPLPSSPARRLRIARRSRVSVTAVALVSPITPIRSMAGRPSMNLDAAASAGRPSRRRICASSTATTTIRPSSPPAFELKCVPDGDRRRVASSGSGQQTVQRRSAGAGRRPRFGSPPPAASAPAGHHRPAPRRQR